jgi:cell division septum initiation protein DivIVA
MNGAANLPNWRDGEREFRRREVEAQEKSAKRGRWSSALPFLIAGISVLSAGAAAWSAYEAAKTVSVNQANAAQESANSQLSTAVTAIGVNSPSEQIAGIELLRSTVTGQLESAKTSDNQKNARQLYLTDVTVLSNYLRGRQRISESSPCTGTTEVETYAADDLNALLDTGEKYIDETKPVNIDLSNVELCDEHLTGINFYWLGYAYLQKKT